MVDVFDLQSMQQYSTMFRKREKINFSLNFLTVDVAMLLSKLPYITNYDFILKL